jgi:FixJ family two-component response regulator
VGGSIDLVVTDLVMPRMGGRQLIDELSRRHAALAVVWMSGHPRDVGFPQGVPKGQPFLQKPIPPDILIAAVEQALQHQASRRR